MTANSDDGLSGLNDAFSLQDRALSYNSTAVVTELPLIEHGILLSLRVDAYLGSDPIQALHCTKLPDARSAEAAICSLLHGAWTGLVSATRLTLYGAHIDATALIRSAFEAAFYAHYFRLMPGEAEGWNRLGLIPDTHDFAVEYRKWESSHKVRTAVEQLEAGQHALRSMFEDLSSFGTHANPKTAGLRSFSDLPRAGNIGFVSMGGSEFTRICAKQALIVLRYVLSEYSDGFASYIQGDPALSTALEEFDRDVSLWDRSFPPGLSRLR